MKAHEAEKLIAVIKGFVSDGATATIAPAVESGPAKRAHIDADQMERIYQEFKRRFIEELPQDPILLQLLTSRPEIILELEPRVVTLDGSTLKGRVARLIAEGFFDGARRTGEARSELARTGSDPNGGQLSTIIGEFVTQGFLTREGDRYKRAPMLKITQKALEAV